jgi:anti-anti-sigma factor
MPLPPSAAALEVRSLSVGHRAVLSVDGDIDIATVDALREALEQTSERDVRVDLTHVRFMDSTGLHAFADAHKAFERDGRRLAIVCPPGSVRRVVDLAGFENLLRVFPDRASARFGA